MGTNLIDLYYGAANLMAARLGLDVASAAQESDLLRRSYGGASAVNYSNPVRRYVYMKTMAARHAVIWREYARAQAIHFVEPEGTLLLNSIGAGPAPEVFGFLEGTAGAANFSRVDVRCLESEPEWAIAGEIVAEHYNTLTGKDVSLTYVRSPSDLHRGAFTLGSMVISDLVRAGTQALLQTVRQKVAPAKGLFLDATKCRSPDSAEQYTSGFVGGMLDGRWINFTQENYSESMRITLEAEIASMKHGIEHDLTSGLSYNGYPMRFT